MFEHSVRVPRPYKIAANIFKKVSTEGGSVKTLLYDSKLRHFRTNALYALITQTIKHAAEVDKIFEITEILKNEPRLDPWIAKVLTTELLFGKKVLPGKSKPEQTISSYKEQFEKVAPENEDDKKIEAVRRPRYVRINTNLITTSDAIRAFQDEEYRLIRCTSGPYDDYLKQIQGLTEYDFTQDYHVKTVFVFSAGTKLHEHELYMENKIILQDKATAMAVHLLAPPPGSIVLDMCAAPGMKTTQLAAYMRNQGKIYAVERNESRYKTLCEFVESTGSKCVETIHKDSLDIKRGDFDDVEYIILDPSCSGSGMELSVHNYIEETRLAKLTSLQEKFLKHAMNAFPKAKRIVYSTCSLYPEENERVITNTVRFSRAKWRVQDVKELLKGQWNNMGSGMYGSMGPRCMYARPESDLTTGFFLAVLDRDVNDMEKQQNRVKQLVPDENNKNSTEKIENQAELATEDEIPKKKRKKSKHNSSDNVKENDEMMKYIVENDDEPKTNNVVKSKKKHKSVENLQASDCQNHILDDSKTNKKKKKKKHAEVISEVTDNADESTNQETSSTNNAKGKKKKKKSKDTEERIESVKIVDSDDEKHHEKSKKHSKKKKRCSIEAENPADIVDINISSSSNFDENNVTITKKKKRKIDESQNENSEAFGAIKEKKKSKKE